MSMEMMTMPHAFPYVTFVAVDAQERAARIEYAVRLLRAGLTRREASGRIFQRYECSRATAWRIVERARDAIGEAK